MRELSVRLAVVCLTLCMSVLSAHAELKLQSRMDAACRPAAAVTYTLLRWKAPESCTSDCFAWRVHCSSGRSFELQSKLHPGTTEFQGALYEWAPWAFLIYLIPFALYI